MIFQLPYAEVKKEMTAEKGLDPAVADRIREYVKHKGNLLFSIQESNPDFFPNLKSTHHLHQTRAQIKA